MNAKVDVLTLTVVFFGLGIVLTASVQMLF